MGYDKQIYLMLRVYGKPVSCVGVMTTCQGLFPPSLPASNQYIIFHEEKMGKDFVM